MFIKVAGARKKKARRCGFAYEAKNMQGNIIFKGVSSCAAETIPNAIQEAMVEAVIKARSLGFNQILFLSDSRRSVQVTNKEIAPSWKERTLMADLTHLHKNGLTYHSVFVSKIVLCNVSYLANLAIRMPIHYSWVNPTFM